MQFIVIDNKQKNYTRELVANLIFFVPVTFRYFFAKTVRFVFILHDDNGADR